MRIVQVLAVLTLLPVAAVALAAGASCEHPAKVENQFNPAAPSCFVIVRADRDVKAVAARVEKQYHVKPALMSLSHGFVLSPVSEDVVAQLRCDTDIEMIGYDAITRGR
ncbi:MAG TPA: hypothetical protein VLX08_03040 [Steroidobacteraceae bacterium]|nr:hypothetical protein [Steroidobacteraceae bacterium]